MQEFTHLHTYRRHNRLQELWVQGEKMNKMNKKNIKSINDDEISPQEKKEIEIEELKRLKNAELKIVYEVLKLHNLGMDPSTAIGIIRDVLWNNSSSGFRESTRGKNES